MTSTTRKLTTVLAALLLVVGAACASDAPDDGAGDGSRVAAGNKQGGAKKSERGKGTNPGANGKPGGKKNGTNADAPVEEAPEAVPGEKSRQQPAAAAEGFAPKEPSKVDPSVARGSASCDEPQPDAQKEGITPAYAEITSGRVEGLGETLRLTANYGGAVPQKMPDKNTFMVIGWAIAPGGNEAYGFTAQASQDGWRAYAGGKGDAEEFPGTFKVSGNTIIMEISWDYVEGPRRFNWQLNSTWFRSLANTTHYAFDPCPNDEAAQYPN